jgi:hypothetical protein
VLIASFVAGAMALVAAVIARVYLPRAAVDPRLAGRAVEADLASEMAGGDIVALMD